MGISMIDAIVIQINPDEDDKIGRAQETEQFIRVEASKYKTEKGNRWRGEINLYRNGDFHRHILTTNPDYDTAAEAISVCKETVAWIRKADLHAELEKAKE